MLEPEISSQSDDRLRSLLDCLDVVIGEWDYPSLTLRFISAQAEKLFGYPLVEWRSSNFWAKQLVHPDDQHWTLSFCKEQTCAGLDHDFEYRVVTASGAIRWIHEYVQLIEGDGAVTERLVCVMIDVTSEKEAESDLREERDFAQGLIETAQAIVLVLDKEGRITMCNPYFEELSGFKLEEVRGEDWFDTFLPGHYRDRICERFNRAMNDQPTRGESNPILTKDGRELEISWWDKGLRNAKGDLIGLLCVGHDITERLQMEHELRLANEQLEARVKKRTQELEQAQEELVRQERLATLGQLAGGVAHEIRNPLAVIRNNVYYFEATQQEPDEDTKSGFAEIYRAMESTEHIIQELLDFARDPKPNENHFTLQDILEDALMSVEIPDNIQLDQSHVDLTVECCGDRHQMARILGNLIRNALDEMLDGGALTITSHKSSETVNISVKDTGKGISKENLARIFEPLHTGKAKGIGLGLAISKRYAELNDADLSVESEYGKGACFSLTLRTLKDLDIHGPQC